MKYLRMPFFKINILIAILFATMPLLAQDSTKTKTKQPTEIGVNSNGSKGSNLTKTSKDCPSTSSEWKAYELPLKPVDIVKYESCVNELRLTYDKAISGNRAKGLKMTNGQMFNILNDSYSDLYEHYEYKNQQSKLNKLDIKINSLTDSKNKN
jgi:hypothetical protein